MRTVVVGDIKGTVDVGHTAYRGNKTVFYRYALQSANEASVISRLTELDAGKFLSILI